MKNQMLNKKAQNAAVDFGKINDAFNSTPNEKLEKIDDYFESKAQVAKAVLPNQPPIHEPAKPTPQQQMAQTQLWSEAKVMEKLLAEQKAKTGPSSLISHIDEGS